VDLWEIKGRTMGSLYKNFNPNIAREEDGINIVGNY